MKRQLSIIFLQLSIIKLLFLDNNVQEVNIDVADVVSEIAVEVIGAIGIAQRHVVRLFTLERHQRIGCVAQAHGKT